MGVCQNCSAADDGDFGEVVRADEEGIVVEDLGTGRLVVGVVQADESIAEEGGELAARGFELLMGVRGF